MDVSRSPTISQSVLSTLQVDRKNQQHATQRQQTNEADESRQRQVQERAQAEEKPKPVVNSQGQQTGRILNTSA